MGRGLPKGLVLLLLVLGLVAGVHAAEDGPLPVPDLTHRFGVADNPTWDASHDMLALVHLYELTGDRALLRRVVPLFERALAGRDGAVGLWDEVRSATLPAWGTLKSSEGVRHAWLVHAAVLLYPMAEFARLVAADPPLEPEFGMAARRYREAAEQGLAAFEADARSDAAGFSWVFPTGWRQVRCESLPKHRKCDLYRARAGEPLPFNMSHAAGLVMVSLYRADPSRRDLALRIAGLVTALRPFLEIRTPPDCGTGCAARSTYAWPYRPGGRMEDMSHGGLTAQFLAEVAKTDIPGLAPDELDRLARTFTLAIAHGTPPGDLDPAAGLAARVDGTGLAPARLRRGCLRWLSLADRAPAIAGLCARAFTAPDLPPTLGSIAWLARATGRLDRAALARLAGTPGAPEDDDAD